jgi:hypothetical protein
MYSTGTDSMGPTDRRINGPARIAFNKEESLPAAGTPSVHAVAMIAVDKSQARSTRNAAMGGLGARNVRRGPNGVYVETVEKAKGMTIKA